MRRQHGWGWCVTVTVLALGCQCWTFARALQREDNVQHLGQNGRPPLVDAVRTRNRAAVRTLLAQRVDVNAQAADGSTALHWAADLGDMEIVRLLINAGADVTAANRYGVTPLPLACGNGNAAVIELLLNAGADPNTALPRGQTALMTAARSGATDGVKLLIAYGADVNAQEELRGQTALMWAAAEGHVPIVDALLDSEATLSAISRGPIAKDRASGNRTPIGGVRIGERLDKFTPLLFATQSGHLNAVRSLVQRGANVNDAAPDGTSALVMAIANGHYELAAYLLDKGADPNAAHQGWNALVQVVRTRNPSVGQAPPLVPTGNMTSMQCAVKLLEHGVDVNAPIEKQIRDRYRTHLDMVGGTAYLMAAKASDSEMMRLLLDHGADPSITTELGRTALMVAAGIDMWYIDEDSGANEDAVEAVKVALDAGADVNAIDDDGDSALHGAAFRGSNEIVQLLVSRGAKLDVKNYLGFTPLMIANGDQRISCNLQRRQWTVDLLSTLMTERGIPVVVRSEEEKFADGVSAGYSANKKPRDPKCDQ